MGIKEVIVFRLGEEIYGLLATQVKEIDRMKELVINKVPTAPHHILGILNLRGEVVPVTDLRIRLGIMPRTTHKQQRVIMIGYDQSIFGVVVDEVLGVQWVPEGDLQLPIDRLKVHEPYITSVIQHQEQMIFMLDVERLYRQD